MKLNIALLQLHAGENMEEQYRIGKNGCEQAKKAGADLVLFPEMWSTGYEIPQDENEIKARSVSDEDTFVQRFRKLAMQLEMAIGITYLERHEPRPLNTILLLDRNGQEVLHYSKVHTCAFDLEKMLDPGEGFVTADLDTGHGMVRVGSMICFDREFPESARILMLQGAELILAPNACPMEMNRLSTLRARAYENMTAIATCNYPKGHPDCNGHSTVFDGIAWNEETPGSRDMCIFEAPEEECVYTVELDLDLLRSYREDEVMGNHYRHPNAYGILSEPS